MAMYDANFMGEWSCNLIKSMKLSFFNTGMSPETELEIVTHLLGCEDCMKVYKEYAKKIGWGDFDFEQYHEQILLKIAKKKEKWIEYCTKGETLKLARSKAIRQIMLSKETDKNFVDYLILNVCKVLDHLENCYNIKEENKNEKP